MREDEDRHVVGRLVAPPSLPFRIPGPVAAAEHPAAHYVGADTLHRAGDDVGVDALRAHGPAVLAVSGGPGGRPILPALAPPAPGGVGALGGGGGGARGGGRG